MTKDDNKEHSLEQDTSSDTTQVFHVVLVDLKEAAEGRIHCVKTPLDDTTVTFVAISYRWGEVQEAMVDTGVGYIASITSFDLDVFFHLCLTITQEVDLQYMQYVWVDAICVNQTNVEQRKATIYHMTDIYQRANYILAVPDLHLRYLKESSLTYRSLLDKSYYYRDYLYYLIKGDTRLLLENDQCWLDVRQVAMNTKHRHLLTTHSQHFTAGLTACRNDDWRCAQKGTDDDDTLHTFNDDPTTKVTFDPRKDPRGLLPDETYLTMSVADYHVWKQLVAERSTKVRQLMVFLLDRVRDWSTRVWVISEYHLAKQKHHKMKYWFVHLSLEFRHSTFPIDEDSFFQFDFHGHHHHNNNKDDAILLCGDGGLCEATGKAAHKPDAVYQTFHATMRQQLSQQTFLEKILKAKASRHEDRFHAILPSSIYKDKLINKDQVDEWHIKTLLDVKLQLYDWMITKHKLELLFLAGTATNQQTLLPSFATSNIVWPHRDDYPTECTNFDLTDSSTIQLLLDPNHQLHIKPRQYYRKVKDNSAIEPKNKHHQKFLDDAYDKINASYTASLHRLLGFHGQHDILVIPLAKDLGKEEAKQINSVDDYYNEDDAMLWRRLGGHQNIVLIGGFQENKWLLAHLDFTKLPYFKSQGGGLAPGWELCKCDENGPGFNIY